VKQTILCMVLGHFWFLSTAVLGGALRYGSDQFLETRPHLGDFIDFQILLEDGRQEADWQDLNSSLQEQLKEISLILQGGAKSAAAFDLKLREALIWTKVESYLRHKAERQYISKWKRYQDGETDTIPTLQEKESARVLFRIVNDLRAALKHVRKHPQLDFVNYRLALALCRVGNENAIFYFNQFARRFKTSRYINDVSMGRAECLFDSGDFSGAAKIYATLTKRKNTPMLAFAQYKLGWAELMISKQGVKSQLAASKALYFFGKAYKSIADDADEWRVFDLRHEVVLDMAWLYALTGREKEAIKFFKDNKLTNDYLPEYYFRKAQVLAADQRVAGVVEYASKLAKRFKNFRRLPEVYQMLINSLDTVGNYRQLVVVAQNMAEDIGEDSDWVEEYPQYSLEVSRFLEFQLRNMASVFKQRGDEAETGTPLYVIAEKILRTYLAAFEDHSSFYNMSFQHASLLFSMGKFEKAQEAFYDVYEYDTDNALYRRDALFSSFLSLSKWDEQKKYKPVPEVGQVKKPIDFPEVKELLLGRIEEFIEEYPQDEAILPIRYVEAQMYLTYGHYEEATEKLELIGKKYSGTEYARNAVKTILNLYVQKMDWAGLKEKCMQYLYSEEMADPQLQQILSSSLEQAESKLSSSKKAYGQ